MGDIYLFTGSTDRTQAVDGVAADQLRALIERVERLNEEIAALNDDKKDVFAEAKAHGFDVPAIKQVIKIRATDANAWAEFEAIVDLYRTALGMTP